MPAVRQHCKGKGNILARNIARESAIKYKTLTARSAQQDQEDNTR